MAHRVMRRRISLVASEHRPSLGLNVLIGSREPDMAFVDAHLGNSGKNPRRHTATVLQPGRYGVVRDSIGTTPADPVSP
jgi:hypothetical protein